MARTNAKSLASFAAKIDGMTRRDFIIAFGALPALAGERQVRLRSNPFIFGVASGDPAPTGVVLWTRLNGAEESPVPVNWEIAEDDKFRRIAERDRVWL